MSLHADVLIVTATKVESKAVFDVFQGPNGYVPKPVPIGDRIYHDLGVINGANVFMVQSEIGTGGLNASLLTVQKGITAAFTHSGYHGRHCLRHQCRKGIYR